MEETSLPWSQLGLTCVWASVLLGVRCFFAQTRIVLQVGEAAVNNYTTTSGVRRGLPGTRTCGHSAP